MSVTVTPRPTRTSVSPADCPLGSQGSVGIPQVPAAREVPASVCYAETSPGSKEEEEGKPAEDDGELTEEEVANCLYNLGHSATGLEYLYRSLSAPGRNLTGISILCNYVHLQKLELPYNKIQDLSCVSHMPYLLILDASHNELSDFGFHPPKNLKDVNFSYNRMSEMKVLSAYSSLSKLNLDHNLIREIQGLEKCSNLTQLSLAHNRISHISGLENLPLRELCLILRERNASVENLERIWTLQMLDLSFNKIQSLSGLQKLHFLGTLNLESNMISEIKEATHIHDLPLLWELNLLRNPIQDEADYRLAVIFLLQQLRALDQQGVTIEEKVTAVNKYDPPPEVTAARDHMMHLVYQLRQPQVIFDSTLPSVDAPYPMLVLSGPQACGKRELAHTLCQDFSDYFAHGTCHTTRSPYFGEEDGSDYHYVSEELFQDMIHAGKFIQTIQYAGHWYGLSREAIEGVAREGLACCVHMELEGVRSLKNTYFEPRYILLVPTDREGYSHRLQSRGLYTQDQINSALSRIDTYIRVNREHPGYFDNVILCDDTVEAYKTLSEVVREYLGLEEQGGRNSTRAMPENTFTGDSLMYERSKGCQPPISHHTSMTGLTDTSGLRSTNHYSKVQARLTPQKSSAEMASLQKRQQLAWEALSGRSPGAYTQPIRRVSVTAPGAIGPHTLQDPASLSSMIPATSDRPPDPGEDSSSQKAHATSSRSSPQGTGTGPDVELLDVPGLGHDLDRLRGQVESYAPQTSRPTSPGVPPEPASPRPGSNAKPILPPIPSGRKSTAQND
ncbi:hypothetical protein AAFF_G00047060 [Aldrovandia affinis]|uniref:Guanylate kinase-like domain-containing protein n=1 Tax=Aldrovandia affinis TaxID=143900 RepID=A0AAD7S1L8_9TELE|nr:hypothetical protein AAFF_G00047060 [Aldrovandia affinis]